MENVLDLKMLDVQELGKEEMKSIDGGSLLSTLFRISPIATTIVLTAICIDIEIIEGIAQGWSENKK